MRETGEGVEGVEGETGETGESVEVAALAHEGATPELVPIDEVARRLGLRASAIRYYEERGLVLPVSRHAGRRWYGQEEIRQLAIVRYWQTSGLMSLEQIGDILAGPSATRNWTAVVEEHMASLQAQLDRMAGARAFLEHVLTFHRDASPDGCPHYESLIWQTPEAEHIASRHGGPGHEASGHEETGAQPLP